MGGEAAFQSTPRGKNSGSVASGTSEKRQHLGKPAAYPPEFRSFAQYRRELAAALITEANAYEKPFHDAAEADRGADVRAAPIREAAHRIAEAVEAEARVSAANAALEAKAATKKRRRRREVDDDDQRIEVGDVIVEAVVVEVYVPRPRRRPKRRKGAKRR